MGDLWATAASDVVAEADIIAVFEDIDGHRVITLWSGERRICDPCWTLSGIARYTAWTGGYDSILEPNLCRAHNKRRRRGTDWDTPLGDVGRPRVNEGVCALDDCEEESLSRGLCRAHYQKDYRAKKVRKEKVG